MLSKSKGCSPSVSQENTHPKNPNQEPTTPNHCSSDTRYARAPHGAPIAGMRCTNLSNGLPLGSDDRIAVSPNEDARIGGIGRSTLYKALANRELKSLKIGGRRLIFLEVLRAWLAAHEAPL